MLASIRKFLLLLILVAGSGYIGFRYLQYRQVRHLLPAGTTIAGVDVSGLALEEAGARVQERYARPISIYHRQERVEIQPQDVGFTLDLNGMLQQAQQQMAGQDERTRFAGFVLERPLQPITVDLLAIHDAGGLRSMVQTIAGYLDEPARPPQMLATAETFQHGQPGFVTDVEASLPAVAEALYSLENRSAYLVVVEQEEPELSLDLLAEVINSKLQSFNGMGSIFVMDLQTGEEFGINSDVALSGLSILKIAIFIEAYRALDRPSDEFQQQLFLDTATRSSNYAANLLLHVVAGEDNTYRGADILTESMRHLGLVNTFIAVPYDATPPAYRQTTYVTPANSRTDITTQPDPTMQSTAEDIGTLLSMIYYCAQGGGALLAVYPGQITPQECQAIIDLMVLNEEGNLIRYGVPAGTPVSHKHGWALGTHADAGIVFSPGGDFVIVEYLNQPGEWLLADVSFPILREIARAVYNYFNFDDPYLGDALVDQGLIDPNDPFSESQEAETAPELEGVTPTPTPAPPAAQGGT
ncbi:MAG: class A beta-lactamase-related serine hydrolase [Chloroflexi bacterium]|nr:class A beta-lactamase-related serine hydrolase [Chloroflexota bacterium]MCI0576232.1 class A beta-lactamase-related serine hydrolase [Chloroflexota bacterium]MCI0645474.1 class A beta-lactamase-related serine hydrolase [Chloroflexota bacterium]MCI0730613.1 class A beta-lactamase-related serine hydrolase [Chloroflexota bacterium]